jgi:adenylate cyclase class 2
MSYQETEIKLPIENVDSAIESLRGLGAKIVKSRHFEDNLIFDNVTRFLRSHGMLLRLRIIDASKIEGILTFKGEPQISDGVKQREEIEVEINGTQNLIRILSTLGFTPGFRYQKYRTIFRIDGINLDFCIDETPIGNYFELEGDIDRIHEFAGRLGFYRKQYIPDSYASLYFRWCKEKGITPSAMTF